MLHLRVAQKTLQRIEQVDHLQALRVVLAQLAQFVAKDHRGFVAVGIHQPDRPFAAVQRRLEDRDHRGDARAAAEQHQRPRRVAGLAFIQAEVPGWRQHLEPVADLHLLVHPVRYPAPGDPLDGHLGPGIAQRRAGHGVAAGQQFAGTGHAKAQELPRLVAKALAQLRRHLQYQRTRIGGFVDDRANLQPIASGGRNQRVLPKRLHAHVHPRLRCR
ncbi:hypothetical protein D3C79_835210 [compost metagenome]